MTQRLRIVAAAAAASLVAAFCSLAAADAPVGWRMDGSGRYPHADPPTEWAADKNVVWKTPMPSWSNSTPVLAGGRLFVGAEPTWLLCVDAADGTILWQKDHSYEQVLTPEEAAQAKADAAKAEEILAQSRPLHNEMGKCNRELRDLNNKKKDEKDPQALKALEDQIAKLQGRVAELKAEIGRLDRELAKYSRYRMPPTHDANGYSSCTPASDGRSVFALFGNGVAACYDLAGERRWIRLVEKPRQGYGHSASPVLVAGKLVLHIENTVYGLDPADGKELWKAGAPHAWGTCIAAKAAAADVVVTASGTVLRVEDGQVLAQGLTRLEYNSPIVHDGTAYFIQNLGKAVRLPAEAAGKAAPEVLWTTAPSKDRYYSSPLLHDGLIYAIQQKGVLSVIDPGDGKVVREETLKLGATVYASVTLAGGYVYVSGEGGVTIVLRPGRDFAEVAVNRLEPFRSSPVFAGSRMYVRAMKHLWCIGK